MLQISNVYTKKLEEKMNKKIMLVYSIIHFVVDFSCAILVSNIVTPQLTGSFALFLSIITYNFFAFAMQLPIGILADRINKNAICSALGCVLVITAFCISRFEIIACLIAGIGNAMFHIGGGIDVLNISNKKATLSGIFVSTGALGIFLGSKVINTNFNINYFTIFILVLSTIALIWLYAQTKNKLNNEKIIVPSINKKELIVIICLIVTVCIRSYVGLILSFSWKSNYILALLFVFGVILGKMFGGILGDRFGFIKVSVCSLGLSAILYTLAFYNSICGILAVLLFNMTMPITLTSLANIFNNNKGLAFGLLTFALFLGAVPVFFGYTNVLFNPISLFIITIFSAIILFIGLKGYNELMEKKYD